jgi:hypothetical protein
MDDLDLKADEVDGQFWQLLGVAVGETCLDLEVVPLVPAQFA